MIDLLTCLSRKLKQVELVKIMYPPNFSLTLILRLKVKRRLKSRDMCRHTQLVTIGQCMLHTEKWLCKNSTP